MPRVLGEPGVRRYPLIVINPMHFSHGFIRELTNRSRFDAPSVRRIQRAMLLLCLPKKWVEEVLLTMSKVLFDSLLMPAWRVIRCSSI